MGRGNQRRLVAAVLRESLAGARVVIKSHGMGFHLPADGIRAHAPVRSRARPARVPAATAGRNRLCVLFAQEEIRKLSRENRRLVAAAEGLGYEAIDTLAITMGRYKEFLQGACACHFHQVKVEMGVLSSPWGRAGKAAPVFGH